MALSAQMARLATSLKAEQDAVINTLFIPVFIPVVSYIPDAQVL